MAGKKPRIRIFYAASLFNGRENLFNILLNERLQSRGYETFLAQRDGFRFPELKEALRGKVPDKRIDKAGGDIIYLFDMGMKLPGSDVVVANMDEPLDPGVDIEQAYGALMGKFVIGFRTDIRSPYGSLDDCWVGMHYFPGCQCHVFLRHDMHLKNGEEAMKSLDELAGKIDWEIKKARIKPIAFISHSALKNPNISHLIKKAKELFGGIRDINSEESLNEIARRYCRKPDYFSPEPLRLER